MSRNYRGDVEMSEIEKFMTLVMEQEDEGRVSPVVQNGELSYIYIKHMNIFREYFCIYQTSSDFSGFDVKEKRKCRFDSFFSIQMCRSIYELF
jgi:hypothetical protein